MIESQSLPPVSLRQTCDCTWNDRSKLRQWYNIYTATGDVGVAEFKNLHIYVSVAENSNRTTFRKSSETCCSGTRDSSEPAEQSSGGRGFGRMDLSEKLPGFHFFYLQPLIFRVATEGDPDRMEGRRDRSSRHTVEIRSLSWRRRTWLRSTTCIDFKAKNMTRRYDLRKQIHLRLTRLLFQLWTANRFEI